MSDDPPEDVDALLVRYLPSLRAFVRFRMGYELRAREESGDIVQSVAREVLQHAERFQIGGEQGFRNWLFTTAHRKVANHLRDTRRQRRSTHLETAAGPELPGDDATPSAHASAREQLGLVEQAFAALTQEQRDIVTWSRLRGLSHAEIAQRTGKTEVAVRKTLSRAMARLVAQLDADAPGKAPPAKPAPED